MFIKFSRKTKILIRNAKFNNIMKKSLIQIKAQINHPNNCENECKRHGKIATVANAINLKKRHVFEMFVSYND